MRIDIEIFKLSPKRAKGVSLTVSGTCPSQISTVHSARERVILKVKHQMLI